VLRSSHVGHNPLDVSGLAGVRSVDRAEQIIIPRRRDHGVAAPHKVVTTTT